MIGMKTVLLIVATVAYIGCTHTETGGFWGEWQSWSSCSTTCHRPGVRTRHRTCLDSSPKRLFGKNPDLDDGSYFACRPGWPIDYEECSSNNTCPGWWLVWDSWSPCNATCNGGWTTRKRGCYPFSDFYVCDGEDRQSKECNTHACVATWNEWSPWSSCSVTCGVGQMTRERNCTTWPTSQFCTGYDRERKGCKLDNCQIC